MKILLVTAVHQRPALTKIILNHYREKDLMRLAIGSEGEASRILVEQSGWNYCEAPNSPLTHKFTALFQEARKYEPDAVLLMGSDDLISDQLINHYQANYNSEARFLMGLRDLYFYHSGTRQAIRHKGFIGTKKPFTIGCGRIFSRALLDLIDWRPWGNQVTERGLDITTSRIFERMGIKEHQVEMAEGGIAVDIKTETGLTKMETFNFNCEPADPSIFVKEFPGPMNEINSIFTK